MWCCEGGQHGFHIHLIRQFTVALHWTECSSGLDVGVDLKVSGKEFEHVPSCTSGDWLLHGHGTFKQLV